MKNEILICGKVYNPEISSGNINGPRRVLWNLVDCLRKDEGLIVRTPYTNNRSVFLTLLDILNFSGSIVNIHGIGYVQFFSLVVSKIRKKKVVYTCHGLVSFEVNMGYKYPFLFRFIEESILDGSDTIVAVSFLHKNLILNQYPKIKSDVVVIPNAIQDSFISDASALSSQFRPSHEYPRVLFLGGVFKTKGLSFLVDALNLMNIDVSFYLGGDSKEMYERALSEKINSKISVNYSG